MIHRQLCSGRDKRPKKEVTPCETLVRIADGLSYQHPFGQWRHTNCIRIFIVFDKLHCFAADSAIYGRFVLYTYMPVDRLQNVGQIWRVQDSNALQCLLILVHCICLMRGEVILELHRFILLVKKIFALDNPYKLVSASTYAFSWKETSTRLSQRSRSKIPFSFLFV